MKVSLSWLKEYIPLTLQVAEVSELLTHAGLEVDGIEGDVLEISLTPNLNHSGNMVGIAREISTLTNTPYSLPQVSLQEEAAASIHDLISVQIENSQQTPRFACRLIQGVTVAPSPEWLQEKLKAAGLRPINNIIDITNFVLHECGQPLHAYDYKKIQGHTLIVRNAKQGDTLTTLDGQQRTLTPETLLICDKQGPLCLAGIMGGADSEVSDGTVDILLESAYFSATSIRRTSKRLGLQTEASRRFERGSDPNAGPLALERASDLIQKLAGGKVVKGVIDISKGPFAPKNLTCRLARLNQILGTNLASQEVQDIFIRLHFQSSYTSEGGQTLFKVEVPTYRVDIQEEIDLIEDVARIYGYTKIASTSTTYSSSSLPHSPLFIFERKARKKLIAEGLQELLTCDLISPSLTDLVSPALIAEKSLVKVLNPTSAEQSILRPLLFPGLLQVIKHNCDRQNLHICGFEVGRTHLQADGEFPEHPAAAIVLTGKNCPHHWGAKPTDIGFFDLKGIVENFLASFGITQVAFTRSTFSPFHPGRQAAVTIESTSIGFLGEVHPAILRKVGISQPVFIAELDLEILFKAQKIEQKMESLSLYPASERDWTITLEESVPNEKILSLIRSLNSSLLEEVTLLDIYRSESVGVGHKNATFRFLYRDKTKTIEQEAVDAEHKRIIQEVIQEVINDN